MCVYTYTNLSLSICIYIYIYIYTQSSRVSIHVSVCWKPAARASAMVCRRSGGEDSIASFCRGRSAGSCLLRRICSLPSSNPPTCRGRGWALDAFGPPDSTHGGVRQARFSTGRGVNPSKKTCQAFCQNEMRQASPWQRYWSLPRSPTSPDSADIESSAS